MKTNATLNTNDGLFNDQQTLRVTALSYLKEALTNERYEECAELVAAAKLFGAAPREIKALIARSVRQWKLGGSIRVPARPMTGRRF